MTTGTDSGGDRQQALTDAFLNYRSVLERIVARILRRSDADVQDIVQDTFLHCYESARAHDIEYPKSFMARTATNLALNLIQRADIRLVDHVEDFDSLDVYTVARQSENPVEDSFAARQRFRDFCDAADALPAKCGEAFVLKRVFGFSQSQIARQMGISESTVEKHVAKGLVLCSEKMREAASPNRAPLATLQGRALVRHDKSPQASERASAQGSGGKVDRARRSRTVWPRAQATAAMAVGITQPSGGIP